jgi:hypothetical protein
LAAHCGIVEKSLVSEAIVVVHRAVAVLIGFGAVTSRREMRGRAAGAGVVPTKSVSARRNMLELEEMPKVDIVIFSKFSLGSSDAEIYISSVVTEPTLDQGVGANSDNGSEFPASHSTSKRAPLAYLRIEKFEP